MGRKEKCIDTNLASATIITKRAHTRQVSNKSTGQPTKSTPVTSSQTEYANVDELNQIDSEPSDGAIPNNVEKSCENVNGKEANAKCRRRLNVAKTMTDEVQATPPQTVVSSIAQRPRRQVKHKFIKSANSNVTETNAIFSVTNKDATNEPNLEKILNSLSPNSRMRLVPMIHRLSVNGEAISWQNDVDNQSDQYNDLHQTAEQFKDTEALSDATTVKYERHKKLKNGLPDVDQNDEADVDNENMNKKDSTECENAVDEEKDILSTPPPNVRGEQKEEELVQNTTTKSATTENAPIESQVVNAIDEEEDDIMIVEEKDGLNVSDQIEYVGEEVVIEEMISDEEYLPCESPSNINQNSISDTEPNSKMGSTNCQEINANKTRDNFDSEQRIIKKVDTGKNDSTEPIYLSDSLSCFDSDSDASDTEIPKSSGNIEQMQSKDSSTQKLDHENVNVEPLNESTDDVIIMPECTDTIEIDQSDDDSDDERFASKFSFEPFIESDSQPHIESVDSSKTENIENGFKTKYIHEATTDADDDSSEVEKRSTRARRDSVGRKNYSYRRTYAKRKLKNDSEKQEPNELSQIKTEDCEHTELEQNSQANGEDRLDDQINQSNCATKAIAVDCNTTDGTDEECHTNSTRTKATRPHLRKNVILSNSPYGTQSENTASSSNDIEVSSDSKPEIKVEPKKRGRPRKKQLEDVTELKSSLHDKKATTPNQFASSQDDEMEQGVPHHESKLDNLVKHSELETKMKENFAKCHDQHLNDDEKMPNVCKTETLHDSSGLNDVEISVIKTAADIDENAMEMEIVKDSISELKKENDTAPMVDLRITTPITANEAMEGIEDEVMNKMESESIAESKIQHEDLVKEKKLIDAQELTMESVNTKQLSKGQSTESSDSKKMEVFAFDNIKNKVQSSKSKSKSKEENLAAKSLVQEQMYVESSAAARSNEDNHTASGVEEPAIECISVKIEKIEINSKAKENVNSERIENARTNAASLKDNTMEFRTEIKYENEPPAKETEMSSAFIDLPKEIIRQIEDTSIRRSGRIRTINKSKQRSQGLGVVKDKRRASTIIVDEDSSSTSFDVADNNVDKETAQPITETKVRVKTEEELEKERIDREKGMKLFAHIADNEYRSERTISKEAKKMTCDCFLTHSEIERDEMGCGDDCLNRMLLIECGPRCVVGDRCTNRRFQKHENSPCTIFKTEKKGYGLIATSYIPAGVFIMEYVGEVLNSKQFEKRANDYSKQMNAHYYFMALSSDCVIDATKKGNISRFINHSCDPNAETQKWTVNGELRIGFFSKKPIMADEEITFDYQFQRYGKEAQKCYCEALTCRGWIGGEPESEEELESEDDEDSEDEASTETCKDDGELSESKVDTIDGSTKKKTKTPKPKKPKDATKKPARKERAKTSRKITIDFQKHRKRGEIIEDPDLDKEIDVLATTGLKNQVQTLQFSRLMVRAKLQNAKLRLLLLLREGELPCRRLFLDYHGLKLMHSWMSDTIGADRVLGLTFRFEILQTLENLPITNKTALVDSKVLSTVQRWSNISEYAFLTDEMQAANANAKPLGVTNEESSPSDSGSGTPILNDETSSPKVDESTGVSNAIQGNDPGSSSNTIAPSSTMETTSTTTPTPTPTPIPTPTSTPTPITTTAPSSSATPPQSEPQSPSVPGTELKTVETIANTIQSNNKLPDVPVQIPQILEQNSTIKGIRLDLLKSIISTTVKNTKIIEDTEKLPDGEIGKLVRDICLLASKLVSTWEQLPESFKIPKKLRIEQMKEHEREADESYKENVEEKTPKSATTFSSSGRFNERSGKVSDSAESRDKDPREKDPRFRRFNNSTTLSKHQRRQAFEAKVAQEDAERKRTMDNFIHEARCAFFQLDPRLTREFMVPVCVNPTTGQWYGTKMINIPTPPSHSHIKPPPVRLPTDINEYHIPPIDLPDLWKYAINEKGQIYYYHTKILIPQWEPPIKLLPLMEEHRMNDIEMKVEPIDTSLHGLDDEHEIEHDCDDEDEDVVSILSNSTMNASCLLELKSDPILEKYNDDDSSSTDSDDSTANELAELEEKYQFVKAKTNEYWETMKKPLNLNEEIAAMAKSDSITPATVAIDHTRKRDEEKQSNTTTKMGTNENPRKRKKNRSQLVQEIRISPLSEEMKRELRRDSRRYKENKAKLRRQKEILLKSKNESKSSHPDAPLRKLKKITEGLPQVSKHLVEAEHHSSIDNHSFAAASFSSSRFGGDTFESKRTKPSAFASLPSAGISSSSSGLLNTSLSTIDTPTRNIQSARSSLPSTSMTQSIVNKLPSIGHKFVGDTEELIIKNTIKPIKTAETSNSPSTVLNTLRSTPTQQSQQQQQQQPQQQQQLQQQQVKKPSHPILTSAKSSPKSMIKKKKTSDVNECIDVNSPAAKKIKEKFKSDISGDIVRHLKPYFSKTCTVGQIQSSDDFRHLARKLTFFVMLKELKYCNNVSLLEVTDSVKNKAREYIKKYMSKFGKTYIRDENEKDYHFEDL